MNWPNNACNAARLCHPVGLSDATLWLGPVLVFLVRGVGVVIH